MVRFENRTVIWTLPIRASASEGRMATSVRHAIRHGGSLYQRNYVAVRHITHTVPIQNIAQTSLSQKYGPRPRQVLSIPPLCLVHTRPPAVVGLAVPAWTSPRSCLEETQDQAVEGEARRDLSAIENLWKLHIEHFKSEFLAVRLDGFVHESLAERFGGEVY